LTELSAKYSELLLVLSYGKTKLARLRHKLANKCFQVERYYLSEFFQNLKFLFTSATAHRTGDIILKLQVKHKTTIA